MKTSLHAQQVQHISNSIIWLHAFRLKTLTAALAPILVGTSLAWMDYGKLRHWGLTCAALISTLCIQIGTNLFNDALDFKKGVDTNKRLGPLRVSQASLISPNLVLKVGCFFFFLATITAIPLVLFGGWPIVIIGILSLFFGYTYTGGPFPLSYKGFGDIFVIIFFGIIAVGGIYYLQSGNWNIDALWTGLEIGFLSTILIAINNLRDVDGDKIANKKTLAVRFGVNFSRFEILCLIIAPFIMNIYWWIFYGYSYIKIFLLPLLTIPLAYLIIKGVFTNKPSASYNHFLSQAAKLNLLFSLLLSIAFCLSGRK